MVYFSTKTTFPEKKVPGRDMGFIQLPGIQAKVDGKVANLVRHGNARAVFSHLHNIEPNYKWIALI